MELNYEQEQRFLDYALPFLTLILEKRFGNFSEAEYNI